MTSRPLDIAIFASGNGSNAENIIRYFNQGDGRGSGLRVTLVVASRPDAYVIERARGLDVPVEVVTRPQLNDPDILLPLLDRYHIDIIVLAGFLLMLPQYLLHRYPGRIVNIHPSLLPRHGGKGMYGANVHRAVKEAGDTVTGITIHLVSEEYDKGEIIFQTTVEVAPDDTPEDIERKIHHLERLHFPRVIRDTFATDTPGQ